MWAYDATIRKVLLPWAAEKKAKARANPKEADNPSEMLQSGGRGTRHLGAPISQHSTPEAATPVRASPEAQMNKTRAVATIESFQPNWTSL